MKSVFVDTAALIAMGDKSDKFHHQALRIRDELNISRTDFVTSSAVVLELASYYWFPAKKILCVSTGKHLTTTLKNAIDQYV